MIILHHNLSPFTCGRSLLMALHAASAIYWCACSAVHCRSFCGGFSLEVKIFRARYFAASLPFVVWSRTYDNLLELWAPIVCIE